VLGVEESSAREGLEELQDLGSGKGIIECEE
jgi:hypothetical protein